MPIQNHRLIKTKYYGRGKLLLTGEYAVLDGAKALALPSKFGQELVVKRTTSSDLLWQSKDLNGKVWFESSISLFDFSPVSTNNEEVSAYLQKVLKNAVRLNSEFLSQWNGFKIETKLDFPLDWGLGSSSTLIYCIAEWSEVNPLMLYYKVEDGSGYDVACAFADGPITFVNTEDEVSYTEVDFAPKFVDKLYFVHLGKKQNTAIGIKDYLKNVKNKKNFVDGISAITNEVLTSTKLDDFIKLLQAHEELVAKHTGFDKVQDLHFSDFPGVVKSLGAWGGDFVLAVADQDAEKTISYFTNKGFDTIVPYKKMVL